MMLIQKNRVLALLALLSTSLVDAKKTRQTREEKKPDRGIPKKDAIKAPPTDPGVTPNVINGQDAPANMYPWYSRGLEPNGEWWGCGGTLITPEFVLTAAHCEYDQSSGFQIGALCEPYQSGNNCGGEMETRWASNVYEHPGWDTFNIVNDFTLVQLSERSTMEYAPPDQGDVSTSYSGDEELWVIGLGADEHYGFGIKTYPDHVQHASVPYVTTPVCNNIMKDYLGSGTHITDVEMCAGPADLSEPTVGTCNGDSGGPIFDKNANTLVGVTSWGIQGFFGLLPPYCGETPGVYARIAGQWDEWIKPTICNNHSSPKPCYCDTPSTCGDEEPPSSDSDDEPSSDSDDEPTSCPSGQVPLKLELTTDSYGEDITWAVVEVKNGGFEVIEAKGHKTGDTYGNNQTFMEETCVPDKCLKFAIVDVYGDGLCCEHGNGGYTLTYDGDVVKTSTFEAGYSLNEPNFQVEQVNELTDIGC